MRGLLIGVLVCVCSTAAYAEDIDATFAKLKEFAAKGEYAKALKEADWIERELQKGHNQKIATFFPDKFGEFNAAGQAKQEGALGMTQIQRQYAGAGGSKLDASLTSGGMASGLGGLMALGQMGALMGAQQGGNDMFRIGELTAMMEEDPGSKTTELMVTLKSGGMVTFELRNGGAEAGKKLRSAVESEFKLNELDAYLQG